MTNFYTYFNVEYGQRIFHSKRSLVYDGGGTPLISSKGTNQGVYGYFDIPPKYKDVISVPSTGTICQAFYQHRPCCIDDNCLVMIPKKKLTREQMLYFVMLVRKQKYRYVYGRQVTPDRLGNTKIPKMIVSFVAKKRKISFPNLDGKASNKKLSLRERKWKYFIYPDLFDIKKGKRIVMSQDLKEGENPFVSSIDDNNGVSHLTDTLPNQKGNTITVNYNGCVGESFYQPVPFWASDDVNILYPNFKLNPYIAIFLITVIMKEKYRFNFGRKWHKERMEKSLIKLPIDKTRKPDWKFMENFIKGLKYSKHILDMPIQEEIA